MNCISTRFSMFWWVLDVTWEFSFGRLAFLPVWQLPENTIFLRSVECFYKSSWMCGHTQPKLVDCFANAAFFVLNFSQSYWFRAQVARQFSNCHAHHPNANSHMVTLSEGNSKPIHDKNNRSVCEWSLKRFV